MFFSTNDARNKCNTSFSCDFDWAIHFLYYFYDIKSSSRSKRQFQGPISKNTLLKKIKLGTCVIPLFRWILSEKSIYGIILVIQGHLQGRKGIAKVKNKMAARYIKVNYDCSTNEARNKCNTSFSCDFDWAIHFLYYFHDSRSFSRSRSQFLGQISKITIFNLSS